MGSPQPLPAVAPQQELPPDFTRRAACPYFSFTTSLMSREAPSEGLPSGRISGEERSFEAGRGFGKGTASTLPSDVEKPSAFTPCGPLPSTVDHLPTTSI